MTSAIEFEHDFPVAPSAVAAHQVQDLRRALEAYHFFYPTVSMEAIARGTRAAGAADNKAALLVVAQPRHVGFTLNSDTPYACGILDLRESGPVVIELPPGPLVGLADDHHQRWITDLGLAGADGGKGGRHLILPPGWHRTVPAGYLTARSDTWLVLLALRVLPLGGLGEIGKNMTVVEHDGRIVVVDVGLRFPTPEMVGIDLVLPDFSYLLERASSIEAIVITHGHEDHLGALPWVLRELGSELPPVYGGALTMAMARSKLDEHKLKNVELNEVEIGEVIELGPFSLEMIHMTHSIPDASAVAHTLAQKGDMTVWQYNVHRGANGELQQAPTAKIGLLANASLRVEPYTTPYAIIPHQ